MIEVENLTKRYGDKTAVDALTFTVKPGIVTGFLGPNGAGKSTTMRMILGLDRPTAGTATINGQRYADLTAPLRKVGALLDAKAVHPGRSAYHHLTAMAATTGVPRARVDEVIDLVGLHGVIRKRAGGFSLGMGQRLGIASALLADPEVLILDEPVNGLDPEGILWIRTLMQDLATQGRTVFVSSHLMSEMALTAEHLIVIGRGKLIADVSVGEFIAQASPDTIRIRSSRAAELHRMIAGPETTIRTVERDVLEVSGVTAEQIGDTAAAHGIPLYELTHKRPSLEEAFMELTRDAVEYQATATIAEATGALAR
ncbi:ABC transporter ATP-binding protein [Micromonospora endophytica]|uniref:Multidrug ABC transporter ATP-binding protein n=1 Tax=Micromonospora endophytica TaxID=515350 RepID=A0A2W2CSF6_9ACTN|nr:ABC transporter ATP-binding protein [Micromonospora endophytica]PZG00801.1 multidrug ABC transporter ATP-binding protein [Micromonospora endophytica]RIW42076.1 ABC transporter ATP-binding protein [Micromonospora endophytica]BCJ59659.1 multidrug ABC transporter ATP-binding protein [Micromonospora endophytica]